MSAISFVLLSFLVPSAMAATFEVPVAPGDRLVLKGYQAQVQLVSQPGKVLRVSGVEESASEGNFTMTKKNNIIEITMTEPTSKKNWLNNLVKGAGSPKILEIAGSPVPVEIHLRSGSVTAQRWSQDLKVSMTQGRLTASAGAGNLVIYNQKGDTTVVDHSGKVEVDTYTGNMALRNIQGDVDATLFSGQLVVEKPRGFVSISSQQSTSKVTAGTGTIRFQNGKGSLTTQGFQGRIEGDNQEGSVSITVTLDSEVDVRTKSGRVQVQVPASSGMSLNLLSAEGEITVPNEVRVTKLGSEKRVRGRLRGDAQRGGVFVRSQDGTISVK